MVMDMYAFGLVFTVALLMGGPHDAVSQTVLNALVPNCTTTITNERGQSLCLWFNKELRTWEEADADCAAHGGYLVAVTAPEIQYAVQEMMSNNSVVSLWLGARETVSTWRWLTNGAEVNYQGCHTNEQELGEEEEYRFPTNNSHSTCKDQCQIAKRRYAKLQGKEGCRCSDSFGIYHTSNKCNQLCPRSREEVCGGTDSSNILVPDGTFSYWEDGQPNNHQDYQACAVMDDYKMWHWNDVKCTEFNAAICEIDADNMTCTSAGYTYDETWGCFTVTNFIMSFFGARNYCHQINGQLLTPDSANKTAFFVNHLLESNFTQKDFFIGLTRSQWTWSSGEPMYFSDWGSSRPNGKDQSCVTTSNLGKWNDVTCDAAHSYICQRGNVTRKPTTTPEPTTTPMTTTTVTVPILCNVTCFPYQPGDDDDKGITHRDIVIYALIGGGTLLGIILISMVLCTIRILKNHFRKKKEKRFDYFFGVDVSTQDSGGQNHILPGPSASESTPKMNGSLRSTEKHSVNGVTNGAVLRENHANGTVTTNTEGADEAAAEGVKVEVLPPSPSASIVFTEALTPSEESLLMKDTSQEVILLPAEVSNENEQGLDNNGYVINEDKEKGQDMNKTKISTNGDNINIEVIENNNNSDNP